MSSLRNWLYTLLKNLGIIHPVNISEDKINAKLAELNKGLNPPQWLAFSEQSSLLKTEFNNGKPTTSSNEALLVKVFYHQGTGELKLFPLRMFRQDE